MERHDDHDVHGAEGRTRTRSIRSTDRRFSSCMAFLLGIGVCSALAAVFGRCWRDGPLGGRARAGRGPRRGGAGTRGVSLRSEQRLASILYRPHFIQNSLCLLCYKYLGTYLPTH